MIILKLKGGLGNQMFQYATGRKLSLERNEPLVLDLSYIRNDSLRDYELNSLCPEARTTSSIEEYIYSKANQLHKLLPFYALIKEKSKLVKDNDLELDQKILYLDGYWQSEKYFKDIRRQLIDDFQLKEALDKVNKKTLNSIKKHNAVAVHLRRTDYVTNKTANKVHGVCSLAYYKKAIEYIENKVEDPYYFIFSDDINWAKNNLKLKNCYYMDQNSIEEGFKDLELMKNCNHFIIANSSFSWWGAWLSESKSKIIAAPKPWFNKKDEGDIVPNDWMRITIT